MSTIAELIERIFSDDGTQDAKIDHLRSLNLELLMTENGAESQSFLTSLPQLLQLINSPPGIAAEVVNMFSHLAMDNPHILRYLATANVIKSLRAVLDNHFYLEVWPQALKCLKYVSQHSPRVVLAGGVLQALSTNNKFNFLVGEDQKNAFEVLRFVADGVEGDSEEDASKFEVALPLLNDLIEGSNEETVQFAARCILRICTAFASRDSYNATAPVESWKAEFLIKALGNPIVVHWFGVLNGDGSAGASVDVLHRKQTRVLSGLKRVVCTAPAVLIKLYDKDVTSKLQHLLREYVGPSDLSSDASVPAISANGEERLVEVLELIAGMLLPPDANLPEGDTAGKKEKAVAGASTKPSRQQAPSQASSAEGGSSSDSALPEGAWHCHMCTFINKNAYRADCEMCSAPRLDKPLPPPVKTLREVYDELPGELEDLCDKLLLLMARVIPMCSSPSVDPLVFEILTRMLSCLGPGSGADCSHGLATSLRMLLHEKKPMALRTGALRLALACLQSGADISSKDVFKEAFVRHGLSAAVEQLRGGGGVVRGKSPPTLFLGFQAVAAGLPPSALLDADLFIIACKANTRPTPTATNSRSKRRKVETRNTLEDLKTIAHALKAEAISAEFAAAGVAVVVPVIEVPQVVSKADGKKRALDEGVEVEMPERSSVTASLQSLADILVSNDGVTTYELEASGVLEALCAYLASIIPAQDEAGVWKASGRDSGLHTFLSIFLTPANGSQTTPMASLVYHAQEALSASTDCFQVVRHCGATEEDRYKALLSTISVRIAAAAETLSTPEGLRLIDASKGAGCTLSVDALKPIGMLERSLRNHFQVSLDQLHINEHMNERRAAQAASAAAAAAASAASTSAPPAAPQRQRSAPAPAPALAAALPVPVPSSQLLRRSPRNSSAVTSFEAPVKKRKASRGGGASSSNVVVASSSAPAPAASAPAAAQADGAADSSDTETIATRLRKRPRRGGDVLPDFDVISLPPATRNTAGRRRSSQAAVPEPTPVAPPVAHVPVADVPQVPAVPMPAVVVKSEAVQQVKKAPPLILGAQVYVYESTTQLRTGAIYLPATVMIIHPADTSGSANTYTSRKEEGSSYTVKTVAGSVYTHVHISQLKAVDPTPSATGELTLVCADHRVLRCNTCGAYGAGGRGGPPNAHVQQVPNHIPGFTHPERPGNRARLTIQIPAPPAIAAPAPQPSPAVAPSRNSRRGKAPKAPAKSSKGRGAAKSKPAAKAKAVAATSTAIASAHGGAGDVRQAKGGSAAAGGGGGSSSGTGGAVPEARGAGRMNVVERAPAPPMPLAEMSWKLLCSDRSAVRARLDLSELPKTATFLEAVQKLLAKASPDTAGVANGHRNVTVTKEHCDQQYILEYSPKRSTPSASSSASRVGVTTRDITFLPASAKVSGAVVHARNTVMSATGSLGGPAANLLLLLKALCTPDSTRTALDDVDAATLASIQSRCVSHGLSRKVMYQSSEAMAVAAEVMPTWCQIAASSYADLLALDARTAYLKRTTYGKARAVEWLQNSASIVAPHASSGRGSGAAALVAHARLASAYGIPQQQQMPQTTLAEDLRTLGDVRRFQVTLRRSEVLEAAGILMTSLVEGLAAANALYGPAAAAVLTRPSRRVGDMGGGGGASMASLGMGGAFLARANDLMFAGGGGNSAGAGAGAFADAMIANESDDGSDSEYEGDGGAGAAAAAFANAMMEEEAAAVQANANRVNGLQELDKESLEYQLTVDFEGETGHGAGPTLEFFSLVSHELQKKKLDVWHESDTGAPGEAAISEFVSAAGGLYPKPVEQGRSADVVKQFRFMGRFIAKAMKDSMLLDLPLSVPLAKMLVGEHTFSIEDVSSIDKSLGRCLTDLVKRAEKMNSLRQKATSTSNTSALAKLEAEVDGMCLSWCLPAYPWYIIKKDEKGEAASVRASELEEYVSAVVKHMLDVSVRRQLDSLVAGFGDVFDVRGLSACSAVELTELISGESNQEYWRASTILSSLVCNHGYTRASQQVISLANVMSQLTQDQQRKFLSFVTGSPRLPVGGFHALQPRLTVVRSYSVDQAPDQKLPSCSTCQVYLKLPEYSSEDILREKILLAITEGRNHFALD